MDSGQVAMNYIKAALTILIPVLTAMCVDLDAWAKAVAQARAAKKPLPSFDFEVAWPRYAAGLLAGIIAYATSNIPLDPIEL